MQKKCIQITIIHDLNKSGTKRTTVNKTKFTCDKSRGNITMGCDGEQK